jgi:hypothetical protein
MVATIWMYKPEPQDGLLNKIHGLSLTNDSTATENKDKKSNKVEDPRRLVHVYIEVPDENKISINEIVVDDANLPPYKFEYSLVEFREYVSVSRKADKIVQYQFVFTNDNLHIGVAMKESG